MTLVLLLLLLGYITTTRFIVIGTTYFFRLVQGEPFDLQIVRVVTRLLKGQTILKPD